MYLKKDNPDHTDTQSTSRRGSGTHFRWVQWVACSVVTVEGRILQEAPGSDHGNIFSSITEGTGC